MTVLRWIRDRLRGAQAWVLRLDSVQRATLIVALGLIAFAGIGFYSEVRDASRERDGCERLDDVRGEFYGLTVDIVTASTDRLEVLPKDSPERQVTEDNLERYKQRGQTLIESVGQYANEDTASPVDIDCSEAYPYPWPLG